MPNIQFRRSFVPHNIEPEHAGLLIDRGFAVDRGDKLHNDDKMELFANAKAVPIPEPYKTAYKNWQQAQEDTEKKGYSSIWYGKLENRMYLGMGEASPLEAGITLHQTYGVPFIPGSAIKGVLSHYFDSLELGAEEKVKIKAILFGIEASQTDKKDSGSAGYLIYNDAWWIPEGKALAPEMITVHAPKYYGDKGKKEFIHPDFESPNPNPQIAIQGSFLFSIEGFDKKWTDYAVKLLSKALAEMGIGGKTASGYGYFLEDINSKKIRQSTDDRIKTEVDEFNEEDIKRIFGKDKNKLTEHLEFINSNSDWDKLIKLIKIEFKGYFDSVSQKTDKFGFRAKKTIYNEWKDWTPPDWDLKEKS